MGAEFVGRIQRRCQIQPLLAHEFDHLALPDHGVVLCARVDQVGLCVGQLGLEGNEFLDAALTGELVADVGKRHRHNEDDVIPVALKEIQREETTLNQVLPRFFSRVYSIVLFLTHGCQQML